MERWVGKVALVTGSSVGIGQAISKVLVRHGLKVIGCGRNVDNLQVISSYTKNKKCVDAGSSGSRGGAGPALPPIFEAPDYIMRPGLHLFTLK